MTSQKMKSSRNMYPMEYTKIRVEMNEENSIIMQVRPST